MRDICAHPVFLVGLFARVFLVGVMSPPLMLDLYVPFLDFFTSVLMFDPWSQWIQADGDAAAFPYGYVSLLVLSPGIWLAKLFGFPLAYGYILTIFLLDFAMLHALQRSYPNRTKLLLGCYWMSPVVIFASYGFGLNDLLPTLLLFLSLVLLKDNAFKRSAVLLAFSISAKLTMVAAIPFFVIYFLNNRKARVHLSSFSKYFALSVSALGIPFILSSGAMDMLSYNPELEKIYGLSLSLGGGLSIYLLPVSYILLLYVTWRIKRVNFELLQALVGMAFLVIVLLTPASLGWLIWGTVFLIFYQAMSGKVSVLLMSLFSSLYVFNSLLLIPIEAGSDGFFNTEFLDILAKLNEPHFRSLIMTSIFAIGFVLLIRIWRETVLRNDYYRLSKRSFLIGVSGDSGAGKDTFVEGLQGVIGKTSTVHISGDDYHHWDRQKPMWKVLTHLNPVANDLERFSQDVIALADGESILSQHYDHSIGKMTKPARIDSSDFVIASGLHALYVPFLIDIYDLKIYLDIDEDLRKFFKIRRDVAIRGHALKKVLESFKARDRDSRQFIRPQSDRANLIFSLQPTDVNELEDVDRTAPPGMRLLAKVDNGFNDSLFSRILVGIFGLDVDVSQNENFEGKSILMEGDMNSNDIAMAASLLCPNVNNIIDSFPKWLDGVSGLMQLVTLVHIDQALKKRLI